jgi:hypothetical protein
MLEEPIRSEYEEDIPEESPYHARIGNEEDERTDEEIYRDAIRAALGQFHETPEDSGIVSDFLLHGTTQHHEIVFAKDTSSTAAYYEKWLSTRIT